MDHWDKEHENNTTNFILVGSSDGSDNVSEQPQTPPEQEAPRQTLFDEQARPEGQAYSDGQARRTEAQQEQQTWHTPGYENVYGNTGAADYTQAETGRGVRKPKKQKETKYVTRKAFVIALICCMLGTSALTVGGYTLASQMGIGNTTKTVSATNYTLAKATGSEKTVEEIIAMNENAVVEIRTESVSQDMWMQNYVTEGAGSGVIVDTKGYILTCNHVIEGSSKVTVRLKDGTECEATVVGTDAQNDVAVLKIKGNNLTAATYGNSDELSVGDLVVAIGNPLGELGGTASQGIISALDRALTVDGKNLTLLQTDASINPGNSGGGLFDQYGNLIGIVVAKSTGSDVEGLGFAIPIAKAADIAKDLIENGHVTGRPAIGVTIIDASDARTAQQYGLRMTGVYIQDVTGSEAKEAGLQAGDMIYYFEDTKIESSADLSGALADHKPGDTVKLTVVRNNKTVEIKVKLSEATA